MSTKRVLRSVAVLALAALVLTQAGLAQDRRHDFSLGYGVLSGDQLADIVTGVLTIVITMGTFAKDDMTFTGVPFLTYHYSSNSRFGFGAAVGGYSSQGVLLVLGEPVGEFKERSVFGAVELDYHWVMKPGFQLYSGAGFGIRHRRGTYSDADDTETYNKILPTFHLNALGLRFGRTVGAFLELGVGYKGMLSAGLNAQF